MGWYRDVYRRQRGMEYLKREYRKDPRQDNEKRGQKQGRSMAGGSFTVEAALLMAVILPVLVSLIYASFFLHDRAVMQGTVCELTAMAGNLRQEKQTGLEEQKDELIKGRFLGTREVSISYSAADDSASASCKGSFPVPGFIMHLLNGNQLHTSASWSRELIHPADLIRKIRGVKYMADTMKE